MYLYFLPLFSMGTGDDVHPMKKQSIVPQPTPDRESIEHTTAQFLPPYQWLDQSRRQEIQLYPPQFFLLQLLSHFFPSTSDSRDTNTLESQRKKLLEFVHSGDPPWTEKCISPYELFWNDHDERAVLGLDKPGPELNGSGRRGDAERVMTWKMVKKGPSFMEVEWREDAVRAQRKRTGLLSGASSKLS